MTIGTIVSKGDGEKLECVQYLASNSIRKDICTRNADAMSIVSPYLATGAPFLYCVVFC